MKTFIFATISAAVLASKLNHVDALKSLAETESTAHTCLSTAKRNKAPVADFWKLVAKTTQYTDTDFASDKSSIVWDDMKETTNLYSAANTWKRASSMKGYTLFGDGITYDDILQGGCGNCWVMAAASAIADVRPQLLKNAFLNKDQALNKAGVYAVTLYPLGVPHTVVVDDSLQYWEQAGYVPQFVFAKPGSDKSMWGPILEKAFAKYTGNFQHMQGGQMGDGVRMLTGAPYEMHMHKDAKWTADTLWAELLAHQGTHDIITVGSTAGSHDNQNKNGLTLGHAFTVLGTKKLSTGQRLVKIRNPWGNEKYKGDWSDTSTKWTAALKKEVGMTAKNDGIFYMSIENYLKEMGDTQINYDTTGKSSAYFLRLDDDGTKAAACQVAGAWGTNAKKCRRHVITVKSDTAQTVYLTAQTWDARTLPASCKKYDNTHWIHAAHMTASTINSMNHGSVNIPPKVFKAGESIKITTEWNWADANTAHDWSVTAWGASGGKVHVTHDGGLTTQHMPVAPAKSGTAAATTSTTAATTTPATTTTTPAATTTTPAATTTTPAATTTTTTPATTTTTIPATTTTTTTTTGMTADAYFDKYYGTATFDWDTYLSL